MIKMLNIYAKAKAFASSDYLTGGIATASILNPAWVPNLDTVSSYLGLVVQVLGGLWLGIQCVAKVMEMRKTSKKDAE